MMHKEKKGALAAVAIILIYFILIFATDDHDSYINNDLLPRQLLSTGNSVASESPFLTPELQKLIQRWEDSTISITDAKKVIWDIVRGQSFTEHKPSHGIVFIKTHKTASSTITSILHSISSNHNLTVPLPPKAGATWNLANSDVRARALNLPGTQGIKSAPYDIWCNHVKFHESLLTQMVPSSGGKYFSIVRDPGTRIQSACAYYGCCPAKSDEIWSEFIMSSDTEKLTQFFSTQANCRVDQSASEIGGKDPKLAVVEMERKVKQGKLLLLVTERMSESLLLLWDFYKLHPLDMTFDSFKVRSPMATEKTQMHNDKLAAQRRVRAVNLYDTRLHRLANEALTRKMEAVFPTKAIREQAISELESLNDIVTQVCLHGIMNIDSGLESWCREKHLDNREWIEKYS